MSYSTGNVYKIICKLDSDIVYIGSTFNSLRNRWQTHKQDYKSYLDRKHSCVSIYPYFEKFGIENFKIIRIKEYECYRGNRSDRKHLNVYEQLWISKTKNCVNKVNPFNLLKYNTDVMREYYKEYRKEYYEKNKEQKKEYQKEYSKKNKEKISENQKEYYEKNREKLSQYQKEYRKEYYEKNKDEISEKKKQLKFCIICKSSCGKYGFKAHERTPKHIKNAKQVIYNFIISKF